MGIIGWFRRLLGAKTQRQDLVPFYDETAKRVIHIPAAELAPGCIRVKIHGIDFEEPVWVIAGDIQPSPIQHPPFDEDVLQYIRRIQAAFAEHRPLSVEEWEEGFRRDRNPNQEIALWVHAMNIYMPSTSKETDPARRKHTYQVIIACLTATPERVRQVLPAGPLRGAEIDAVVRRFFPDKASGS